MQYHVEIQRVIPFSSDNGGALAAVQFLCGPLIVHGKLWEKEGRRWLQLPARKDKNENWHDQVTFVDRSLQREVERLASMEYDRMANLPEEMTTARHAELAAASGM